MTFVLTTILLSAACASTPAVTSANRESRENEAAIRMARANQNRAMQAGDVARAAQYWTEDVTIRRGLGASTSGREEYSQLVTSIFNDPAGMIYDRTPLNIEVSGHWPLAFETGTWFAHLVSDPATEQITGRYSAQWVKRNGRWLIRSEVFVALRCKASGCAAAPVP